MKFKIALYPGDGIGPDVLAQAERVMYRVGELQDITFDCTTFDWGMDYWHKHGQLVPTDFLAQLKGMDAILLGAVGWPDILPDHETLAPLVEIRQSFDQYACVRPARLCRGLDSVLAGRSHEDIDFVVIRENSEGEYVDNGGRFKQGSDDEVAVQTAVHTRKGVERILRYAFEFAQQRRGRLTMVTKSNAMKYSYVMWDDILADIRNDYPAVKEVSKMHCDAAVMNFVRHPDEFDVVVASNLFGDLLTDLGGILGGGLGLAPSCNVNPTNEFPSMFEPVHGSAPDIAGQGIANPIACVLSLAMMLDHLQCSSASESIRQAVEAALLNGSKTPDLGGELTTEQMGDAVLAQL